MHEKIEQGLLDLFVFKRLFLQFLRITGISDTGSLKYCNKFHIFGHLYIYRAVIGVILSVIGPFFTEAKKNEDGIL